MTTTGKHLNRETSRSRLGKGFLRLLSKLRLSVLRAIDDESTLAEIDASRQDEKSVFDRLPDPPHLGFGEVKYFDGKLRYFDE